jgi:hypothetical protein
MTTNKIVIKQSTGKIDKAVEVGYTVVSAVYFLWKDIQIAVNGQDYSKATLDECLSFDYLFSICFH